MTIIVSLVGGGALTQLVVWLSGRRKENSSIIQSEIKTIVSQYQDLIERQDAMLDEQRKTNNGLSTGQEQAHALIKNELSELKNAIDLTREESQIQGKRFDRMFDSVLGNTQSLVQITSSVDDMKTKVHKLEAMLEESRQKRKNGGSRY